MVQLHSQSQNLPHPPLYTGASSPCMEGLCMSLGLKCIPWEGKGWALKSVSSAPTWYRKKCVHQ